MPSNSPPSLPFPPPRVRIDFDPKRLIFGLIVLVLLVGLFSSFYTVPTDSVAIVQRFGAYHDKAEPGLRFKLPFGIDTREIVPVRRQLKLEFGYGTSGATNPYQSSDESEEEKSMVTGDLNSASVEWVVQYTISDPKEFLFEFKDPTATLRDLSEAVMREIVGDRTVDEIITVGREEAQAKVLERLQGIVDTLQLGLHIDQVQLGNVNPPVQVAASFDEVNRAQQEQQEMIQKAKGEYNKVVPRATGEAKQRISAAEGNAAKRVNEAEGDAARFNALLAEYKKAPEVTLKRMYLETMAEVLPQLPGKVILDDKASQFLPLMHLQQPQPPQPNTEATVR
ncbi:MAG: FtsH protease activity modulator HflK [Verrucomicrobiaceae bacterium]|nr:FtsH protease activity modulator HflK [Verrucomicrobiaceae bacterium]